MMPLPFKKRPLVNFTWFMMLSFDMLVRRGRKGRGEGEMSEKERSEEGEERDD